MAFPSVAGSTGNKISSTTTHNVSLPASIAAGNLILVFIVLSQFNVTLATPSGWTLVRDQANSGWHQYCFSKVATGGETSQAFTSSANAFSAYVALRITGSPTNSIDSAGAASVDPPNLAPQFGNGDHLWLATMGFAGANLGSFTTYPTNYTNVLSIGDGSTPSIAVASRQLTAASDDPSTFAYSDTPLRPTAMTVAIAGDALPGVPKHMMHYFRMKKVA